MDERTASTLIVRFAAGNDDGGGGGGGTDPKDPPCPLGFTGPIPDPLLPPPGFVIGPPEPPEPPERRLTLEFETHSAGKILGYRSNGDGPGTTLTVHFGGGDDDDDDKYKECYRWSNIVCWRPRPLAFINYALSDVDYQGTYLDDEALPSFNATFDPEAKSFQVEEIDGTDPVISIKFPSGNLSPYLDIEGHGNNWFFIETHFRLPPPADLETPEMWITGPWIPGDTEEEGNQGKMIYGLRIPVRFFLTAGLLDPTDHADVLALEPPVFDMTLADTALKPSNGPGGMVMLVPVPVPGEEDQVPGVDFTAQALNDWAAQCEDPEAIEDALAEGGLTLCMEVLPCWGKFILRAQYACGPENEQEVFDLQGGYSFNRAPSWVYTAPLITKPVAYVCKPYGDYVFILHSGIVMRSSFKFEVGGFDCGTFDWYWYEDGDIEDPDQKYPTSDYIDWAVISSRALSSGEQSKIDQAIREYVENEIKVNIQWLTVPFTQNIETLPGGARIIRWRLTEIANPQMIEVLIGFDFGELKSGFDVPIGGAQGFGPVEDEDEYPRERDGFELLVY